MPSGIGATKSGCKVTDFLEISQVFSLFLLKMSYFFLATFIFSAKVLENRLHATTLHHRFQDEAKGFQILFDGNCQATVSLPESACQ